MFRAKNRDNVLAYSSFSIPAGGGPYDVHLSEPREPAWLLDRQLNLTLLGRRYARGSARDLRGIALITRMVEFLAFQFGRPGPQGVVVKPEVFADLWYSGDVPFEKLQTFRPGNCGEDIMVLESSFRISGLRVSVLDGKVFSMLGEDFGEVGLYTETNPRIRGASMGLRGQIYMAGSVS